MRNPLLTLVAALPLAGLAFTLPTPPPLPQDALNDRAAPEAHRVYYYTVEQGDAYFIGDMATTIYGVNIPKLDPDGHVVGMTENIIVLDDHRLLIYDRPSSAEKILTLCKELDVPAQAETQADREFTSEIYTPRYVSVEDARLALEPFNRVILESNAGPRSNLQLLGNSGRLMLRDTAANLDKMRALLDELDRSAPQIELTCYVLRGLDEPVDNGLPKELTDNLSRIVPFPGFDLATMGVVRTSADSSGASVSIEMPGIDERFELDAQISAFDAQGDGRQVLTLSNCRMKRMIWQPGSDTLQPLFETNVALGSGEYAVMGATGSNPIFVVLRFERVEI